MNQILYAVFIYGAIVLLFLLGIGLHVTQEIDKLRIKYPDKRPREIMRVFFEEEWNVLIRSALIMILYIVALVLVRNDSRESVRAIGHHWGIWPLALILGYAGQRILYAWLGTSVERLARESERLNKSN